MIHKLESPQFHPCPHAAPIVFARVAFPARVGGVYLRDWLQPSVVSDCDDRSHPHTHAQCYHRLEESRSRTDNEILDVDCTIFVTFNGLAVHDGLY